MVPTFDVAPGLSAVTEPALAPGALGTPRYRRWADRLLLLTEARRHERSSSAPDQQGPPPNSLYLTGVGYASQVALTGFDLPFPDHGSSKWE